MKETAFLPTGNWNTNNRRNLYMLLPAFGLMGGVLLFLIIFLLDLDGMPFQIERPYLIPWVLATGAVICAPSAYLMFRRELTLIHPLVFATLTYFFPIFFLGGWSLTFGLSNYYYLAYVTDPEYNFPLTFIYVMLGFGGLSVGFFIPPAKTIGQYIARRLPVWDWQPAEVVIPSLGFLVTGIFASLVALELGQIGYQSDGIVFGETGSLNYYLTMIIPASTFLLWLAFFKFEKWNNYHLVIGIAQVIITVWMLVLLGGRSSLLQSILLMILAFVMAGRKILLHHWLILGAVLPVVLIFGMAYGTTFRVLKSNADRISAEQYYGVAVETIFNIADQDVSTQSAEAFNLLAERLEIVSSLGVVVANHERLQSYEASYGLENNIWTYTWTGFIPRFLWIDKPVVADGFSYNELYFDHGGFGLAITAMGDLLRNFGPFGVPLGMLILGFAIRIFYATFIEEQPFSMWRSTIYFTVLAKISYDSFYGEILPTAIRVAAVVFIQLLVLKIIIYGLRRSNS